MQTKWKSKYNNVSNNIFHSKNPAFFYKWFADADLQGTKIFG